MRWINSLLNYFGKIFRSWSGRVQSLTTFSSISNIFKADIVLLTPLHLFDNIDNINVLFINNFFKLIIFISIRQKLKDNWTVPTENN